MKTEDLKAAFCDGYCHWPYVCEDEFTLAEHCADCPADKLVELAKEGGGAE